MIEAASRHTSPIRYKYLIDRVSPQINYTNAALTALNQINNCLISYLTN
jgi:hypothetical protein